MEVVHVGLSCLGIKVLLSEFPGNGDVGAKNSLVDILKDWPFIVSSGVKGVIVSSDGDWVSEGVSGSNRL